MRARGLREQVGVLIGALERVSKDFDVVKRETITLGVTVTALADSVDDHEKRIKALEKRR